MLVDTSDHYGTIDLATGGIRKSRLGRTPFDETVKVVCHDCNNGWMNQVDQDAEPAVLALFEGTPFLFTPDNSRQVASWACKVTLMRAHQNAEIGIAAGDFHWFFKHRVPPPNWVVFLGQTDPVGLIDECRYIVEERPPGRRQNHGSEGSHRLISADSDWFLMQQHSLRVGQMLLMSFAVKGPPAAVERATHILAQLWQQVDRDLVTLWPEPAAFDWPQAPISRPVESFAPLLFALPVIASAP